MGDSIFLLAIAVTAAIVLAIAGWLASCEPDRSEARLRLFAPAAAVLAAIVLLYFGRSIPPVPLSLTRQGIYHDVRREGGDYFLRAHRPRRLPWRKESRPFLARPGDRMVYFVSVFAPRRFEHRVNIRWERWDPSSRSYVTTDLVPIDVVGGRDLGFRGYAVKSRFDPGPWRVGTETEDGRSIGRLRFDVLADAGQGERSWIEIRM
jgi:hypothetical protein